MTCTPQVEEHKTAAPNESVKSKDFGKPQHVQSVVTECVKKVKSFISKLQNKMELYLANSDTQSILYKPIKVRRGKHFFPDRYMFNGRHFDPYVLRFC